MGAVCLLLQQLPGPLLGHLLHRPHLNISDLKEHAHGQHDNRRGSTGGGGVYLDVRGGTEDKCDCTGDVVCFQTLKRKTTGYL